MYYSAEKFPWKRYILIRFPSTMLNLRHRKWLLVIGLAVLTILMIGYTKMSSVYLTGKTDYIRTIQHSNITMVTNQTEPVTVIILAYMHTGSSYTGSIFQQHPGTFYHYEPLRHLQERSRRHLSVQYLNGSHRRLSGTWLPDDVARETANNMLKCKYTKIDIGTLTTTKNGIKGSRVRDQSQFLLCVNRHRQGKNIARNEVIKNCLPYLITPCLQANIRAFKFIRLPMAAVKRLITENGNLRVIHLVRDPRAMLDSQVRKDDMGSRQLSTFTENTKRLCDKMHRDYDMCKSFPPQIRQNIQIVRYEDLTESPSDIVEQLFHFNRIQMSDQDRQFVKQTTRKGDNSSGHDLEKWRSHIAKEHVRVLNTYCRSVYKDFNYIEYQDLSDIRNRAKPTFLKNV